jgi:hypothetical protein
MNAEGKSTRPVQRPSEEAWIVLSQAQFLEAEIQSLRQILQSEAPACFSRAASLQTPVSADSVRDKRKLLTNVMLNVVRDELSFLRDHHQRLVDRAQELDSHCDRRQLASAGLPNGDRESLCAPAFLLQDNAGHRLREASRIHPGQIASMTQGLRHLRANVDYLASGYALLLSARDAFPGLELATHEFFSRAFRYSDLGRALDLAASADANLTLGKMCFSCASSAAWYLEGLRPVLPQLMKEIFQDVLGRENLDESARLVRAALSHNSRVVKSLRGRSFS